jgi:hypothetical protein
VETLRERSDRAVYRVHTDGASFVLKRFRGVDRPLEPQVYKLLQTWGVPTLPVHARTEKELLLEDLDASSIWREALASDLDAVETGTAVAEWYLSLHQAGHRCLADPAGAPSFLSCWVDEITQPVLYEVGHALALTECPGWDLVTDGVPLLCVAYKSFPLTFNYSDFALENLALTRGDQRRRRAIVYDYDQFKIGTTYSDWRNVVFSLQGASLEGFKAAYGPVSEAERILDEPLSKLYVLLVAARRPRLPGFARPSLDAAKSGVLAHQVQRALAYLETWWPSQVANLRRTSRQAGDGATVPSPATV